MKKTYLNLLVVLVLLCSAIALLKIRNGKGRIPEMESTTLVGFWTINERGTIVIKLENVTQTGFIVSFADSEALALKLKFSDGDEYFSTGHQKIVMGDRNRYNVSLLLPKEFGGNSAVRSYAAPVEVADKIASVIPEVSSVVIYTEILAIKESAVQGSEVPGFQQLKIPLVFKNVNTF